MCLHFAQAMFKQTRCIIWLSKCVSNVLRSIIPFLIECCIVYVASHLVGLSTRLRLPANVSHATDENVLPMRKRGNEFVRPAQLYREDHGRCTAAECSDPRQASYRSLIRSATSVEFSRKLQAIRELLLVVSRWLSSPPAAAVRASVCVRMCTLATSNRCSFMRINSSFTEESAAGTMYRQSGSQTHTRTHTCARACTHIHI